MFVQSNILSIMSKRILVIIFLLPTLCNAQLWTLDSCIQYAYAKNISIQQSDLNVQISEATEQNTLGNMLPSLNGQATHGYNWGQRIDPFTNQFATERIRSNNFGLSTNVTLFNGFTLLNTWKQSELNSEVSKWNYEKMRNDVALNVASAYLNVLLNRELLYIAQQNMEATQRQVTRLEKLVTAGQLANGNLADAKAQLANDKGSMVSSENSYNLAKLALMQLLRLDPGQMESFELFVPELGEVSAQEIIANPEIVVQAALNNFPEVKGAATKLASADMGVKIAKGYQMPSLNASYSYGTGYSGASKVLSGSPALRLDTVGYTTNNDLVIIPGLDYDNNDYVLKPFERQMKDNVNQSLFFSLTIPIFNGFSTRTNIKRAELNQQLSALQLEQTKQNLEQSVYRSYADAQAALAAYNAAAESVLASETAFVYAESRYENGQTNIADYSDARTRVDRAKATLARSKYDFIFKLKVLEFYQGKSISLK